MYINNNKYSQYVVYQFGIRWFKQNLSVLRYIILQQLLPCRYHRKNENWCFNSLILSEEMELKLKSFG